MSKTAGKIPADYILPLYMNGLSGRMLRMAPPKNSKLEILFIYGHHASLERYFGVGELMNKYGGLSVPDLPGFGGMDSFYKIGEKPTLDNFADYLASFIKLRYKNRRFVVAGYSLGVVIITRMLQKYPELSKKVDMVVSIGGFSHRSDFSFSPRRYWIYRGLSRFMSMRLPAAFYKHAILRPMFIRYTYRHITRLSHAREKFVDRKDEELEKTIALEVDLWRCNDPRTYMATGHIMITLDLPSLGHVGLPIYHAGIVGDHYFHNLKVEQHLRQIYADFHYGKIKSSTHAPSVVATARDAKAFLPKEFIRVMKKLG